MLVVEQKKSRDRYLREKTESALRCDYPVMAIKPGDGEFFAWPGTGEFLFELASQPHFQPAFKALIGCHEKVGQSAEYNATLVIDDRAQDSRAVRVEIDGVVVGFFGAREARNFLNQLDRMRIFGRRTTCAARIFCAQRDGDGLSEYRLALDLQLPN